jgi:hypothetical protein
MSRCVIIRIYEIEAVKKDTAKGQNIFMEPTLLHVLPKLLGSHPPSLG